MELKRKLRLGDNIYYVVVKLEYRTKPGFNKILSAVDSKDSYFDSGDFSILLDKISKNYSSEKVKEYDNDIFYMADCIYIYNHIPFLSAIEDVSSDDELPNYWGIITRKEIEDYIKKYNIKLINNDSFLLYDQRTWIV